MKSKCLLLTGADGFTGKHFKKHALDAGYDVHPLVSDLTDRSNVFNEVHFIKPAYVCHLGGISSPSHKNNNEIYDVNLIGTINLLDSISSLNISPKKIVLSSSASVYGSIATESITETKCPAPNSHYAISKLAMENVALSLYNNLPIIISRPFNYTGVGQNKNFLIAKIVDGHRSGADQIELGNLDIKREYNDVRMICDSYLKLLEYGKTFEIYNICSGVSYGIRDVLYILKNLTGKELRVISNSKFIRANDAKILVGSPNKLEKVIGPILRIPLEETLKWMLEV